MKITLQTLLAILLALLTFPSQAAPYAIATRDIQLNGYNVSVDSFNTVEVAAAVKSGAELVLSVNHSNIGSTAADIH